MDEFWKTALASAIGLVLMVGGFLAGEGLYSLTRGAVAQPSLSYQLYTQLGRGEPPEFDAADPNARIVTRAAQIEAILEQLAGDRVGLGNSPFGELKTPETRMNRELDGCLSLKPDLDKRMAYIRSNLYNPFDQITAFYDADRELSPEVETFLERYAFRSVRQRTNEHGERLTLPRVEAQTVVLVAGDSVANGAMLEDDETLSSQLQARDRTRRFVNLGVPGARSADVLCALDRASERYAGRIQDLVYVFCENDFSDEAPYGRPEALIERLAEFRDREGLERVVFVYTPYVYNVLPEMTRVRGHSHYRFPTYRESKRTLLRLAREAGFAVVDWLDATEEAQRRESSLLAPLALYLDHIHLSPRGTRELRARVEAEL